MLLVGLTGGIGSGKTTVAELLRVRGAVVLDADRFAREAVAPGSPALARVAARFGPGVVTPAGSLDRERMAEIAFADPAARGDLEAIVHPEVARRHAFDVVVVVTAPEENRVARLRERGMAEGDARARIAAQVEEAERLGAADLVLDNGGTMEALAARVDRLWADLERRSGGRGR